MSWIGGIHKLPDDRGRLFNELLFRHRCQSVPWTKDRVKFFARLKQVSLPSANDDWVQIVRTANFIKLFVRKFGRVQHRDQVFDRFCSDTIRELGALRGESLVE